MFLITGGAGFIGSRIASRLVAAGERVRIFDRRAPQCTDAESVQGDIRNLDALWGAMRGVDVVFHHAAMVSVPESCADPHGASLDNAEGTLNVLTAAREAGVRRVVYASTSAVYGDDPKLPKHESDLPQPASPYAATKLAGEHYCAVYARLFGLEAVALRYFNVYGSGQDPNSPYAAVIPAFMKSLVAGEAPVIYGDGHQTRDFVHVDDVAAANLLAASASGVSGRVFNVASGRRTDLLTLWEVLRRIAGVHLAPRHESPREGDVAHSVADISAAQEALGFEPRVALEDGLRSTFEWFRRM